MRGSSRGIAKASALARVRCGANVVVSARTAVRRLHETETALGHFGRVDLLINNAAFIGKGMFEVLDSVAMNTW